MKLEKALQIASAARPVLRYRPVRKTRAEEDAEYAAKVDTDKSHCVYFAYAAGRIKIGLTEDPYLRGNSLSNGGPVPVTLLGIVMGGRITEFKYHHRFAKARLHGEWFRLTPELREEITAIPDAATKLSLAEEDFRKWLREVALELVGMR